jgi:L-ribulose-5-phosphate 4-epimerase
MLEELKEKVLDANLQIHRYGLAVLTFGNLSAIDHESGHIVIKPSGVPYEDMTVEDLVVTDLKGNVVEGHLRPSSDTPTHLVLYHQFHDIGTVVHTHSEWATSWAQAGRSIPCYGTTHADYFYGDIPCTRKMKKKEIREDYEKNTGLVIIETFAELDYHQMPAVLVYGHGPFVWGMSTEDAIHNAVFLEEVAKMAFRNEILGNKEPISQPLLDKHFLRKHGKDAYYGQEK